jgi:hypothetical protein
MRCRGIPDQIRSDNGPEFVAKELRKWLGQVGSGELYMEPGSPWENGYCQRSNGKLREECLNREIFYSLKEAQIVIEQWRQSLSMTSFRKSRFHSLSPPACRLQREISLLLFLADKADFTGTGRVVVSLDARRAQSEGEIETRLPHAAIPLVCIPRQREAIEGGAIFFPGAVRRLVAHGQSKRWI